MDAVSVEGLSMDSGYDLYKRLPNDRLLWIERVQELDTARRLVAAMKSASMGEFLVYDFRERTVVEIGSRFSSLCELAS